MTTNEQISHELRANLNRVITILRPYAQSSGPFYNLADLETARALRSFIWREPGALRTSSSEPRHAALLAQIALTVQ
jgi:hypothetical protein